MYGFLPCHKQMFLPGVQSCKRIACHEQLAESFHVEPFKEVRRTFAVPLPRLHHDLYSTMKEN